MSYMNEDHGNEHEHGSGELGDYAHPTAPAAQRACATHEIPPIPTAGPGIAGPTAPLLAKQASLSDPPAADSAQVSQPSASTQDPLDRRGSDEIPESFANVARIVERSAMNEKDRLEIFLDMLLQMSPMLHGIAVASTWDSRRVAKLFTAAPRSSPLPSDSHGRDAGGGRVQKPDHPVAAEQGTASQIWTDMATDNSARDRDNASGTAG